MALIKLQQTMDRYRQVTKLHPAVDALIQREPECEQAFLRLIRHERDMINARSQDFEDHEITITQKAFTTFMESTETLHAAIEIFVEELLGLGLSREKNKNLMIEDAVNVRAGFLEEHDSSVDTGASLNVARFEQTHDPKLARLESLCEKAKAEMETSRTSRYEKANAAKFLRDTAENTIKYIEANNLSSQPEYGEKLKDLHKTFREAAAAARQACYGKPGPFEISSANLEPLGSLGHRTPITKRGAKERRHPPSLYAKRDDYGSSEPFQSAAGSAYRERSRRSASPYQAPSFKHEGHRRFRDYPGDRYRSDRGYLHQ